MRTTLPVPAQCARCTQAVLLPHDLGSAEHEQAVRPPHRFPEGIDKGLGDWRHVRGWIAVSSIEFALEHRPQFAGQGSLARLRRPPIPPHVGDIPSVIALHAQRGGQASLVQATTLPMHLE